MNSSTIVWIVVAIIVVLAVAALVAALSRRKATEQRRVQAQQLRQEAVTNVDSINQTHVEAKEAEARAERARLEAERAEAQAAEAQRAVDMEHATYEDRLREADRLDPDVDHHTEDRAVADPLQGGTGRPAPGTSATPGSTAVPPTSTTEGRTGPYRTP